MVMMGSAEDPGKPPAADGAIRRRSRSPQTVSALRITLLHDLEIDVNTNEYHVNGGEWHYALSADCDGIEISYPSLVALTDDELGTLAPVARAIRSEADIGISIAGVVYD